MGANPNHVSKSWDDPPCIPIVTCRPPSGLKLKIITPSNPATPMDTGINQCTSAVASQPENNTDSKEGEMTFVQPYDVFFFSSDYFSFRIFNFFEEYIHWTLPPPCNSPFFFVSVSVSGHFFWNKCLLFLRYSKCRIFQAGRCVTSWNFWTFRWWVAGFFACHTIVLFETPRRLQNCSLWCFFLWIFQIFHSPQAPNLFQIPVGSSQKGVFFPHFFLGFATLRCKRKKWPKTLLPKMVGFFMVMKIMGSQSVKNHQLNKSNLKNP